MLDLNFTTTLMVEWGIRCFGIEHMADKRVRTLRFLEEAAELAQSVGVDQEVLHSVISKVFEAPPGKPVQELGGTMITLLVLCNTLQLDLEASTKTEVARVLRMTPGYFAERNKRKLDMGLK